MSGGDTCDVVTGQQQGIGPGLFIHTEKVWGGPCDSHNCNGNAVAFISIPFTDGGSVGGYFCRTHLNQYEVAYGLPRTTEALRVAA